MPRRRDHDHDGAFQPLPVGLEKIEAVTVGQVEVEQDDVGLLPRQVLGRRGEIGRSQDVVAGVPELPFQGRPENFVVLDDQDVAH